MKNKFDLFKAKAFELMLSMGFDVHDIQGCQYELILESGLEAVIDTVIFPAVGYRGEREFITEIRLNRRDTFIANEWGLFLLNTDGRSDVKFEEHTYPDEKYFGKESAEEAGIFYNANLSFVVNNQIVLPNVRTDKFKRYIYPVHRREIGLSGLVEIGEGECLVLLGSRDIYFKLDLPRKMHLKDSAIRLRLRLSGLLFRIQL